MRSCVRVFAALLVSAYGMTAVVPAAAQVRALPANEAPGVDRCAAPAASAAVAPPRDLWAASRVSWEVEPGPTVAGETLSDVYLLPDETTLDQVGPADDWLPPRHHRQLARSPWTLQILPDGLLYPAYLAGGRESRFASQWVHEDGWGWLWDVALGGHVGILRYGTTDKRYPEGWQIDIEGAGFPRLDLEHERDLVSADFRFGVPLTVRRGRWEAKLAYYHLSSHLGDELLERFPEMRRINYTRDVIVAGVAVRPNSFTRVYGEVGYAFYTGGGSQPWEIQFGIDLSSLEPTDLRGTPFFAINGRLREEVDFGGNMTVQTGWQWRGHTGHLFRLGLHYFNGKSDQYEFFTQHEEQLGVGLWYDY